MITSDDDIYKHDDNERLETYLKQFQPVKADPLPHWPLVRQTRHSYMPMIWAISFVMVLIAGALTLDYKSQPQYTPVKARVEAPTQPPTALTIRSANLLLKGSSSVAEALNAIAYIPQTSLPQGASSALATLGMEKFKL